MDGTSSQDSPAASRKKKLKKILPVIIIFIPLFMVFLFSFSIFFYGTPEFRVDKTQNGLKIGKIHHPLNPIQTGELIVRINGLDYHKILSLFVSPDHSKKKQEKIRIKKGDTYFEFKPELRPISPFRFLLAAWPHLLLISILILLGVISYLHTTGEQPTFLFLMATSFFATLFSATLPSYFGILDPYTISLSFFVLTLFNWVAFGACLHFVFSFPADRNIIKNKKWMTAVFYLSAPLISITCAWILADSAENFWGWLQRLRNVALPFLAVTAFTKHFIDYRKVTSSLEKSQIKLIISSYWLSLGPYIIFYAIPNMLTNNPLIPFKIVVLSSIILPGAYFIALIRYRLLDVDKMISRTLSYFLLIGLLLVSYSYLSIFLQKAFMGRTFFSEEIFLIYIILVAVLFEPANKLISFPLDKLFLPKILYRYDMLPALSQSIGTSVNLKDLLKIFTQTIPKNFHINHIFIFLFEGDKLNVYPENPDFNKKSLDLRLLKTQFSSKINFLFCTPSPHDDTLKKELLLLQSREIELIFALRSSTGLSGLLLLGNREDKKAYTRRDIEFFTTISNEAGLALENAIRYEALIESKKQIEKMFKKVVQSEKMAALGEMAAILAHELKNPLGIIRSSAQYLSKNEKDTKTREELLEYIIGEVDGLESIINNMMKLARNKVPDLAAIDLRANLSSMIDHWIHSGNHNKTVSIQLTCPETLPEIFADFKQLQQVFLNCISNAEDVMPQGGNIFIAINYKPDDTIDIHISDTGPGIPQKDLENAFKKFFTTKEKGLGIGLSVCKQIVLAHSGHIAIENREQGGVKLRINLPREPLTAVKLSNSFEPHTKESNFA
jgi:signal transduction histidine kinase